MISEKSAAFPAFSAVFRPISADFCDFRPNLGLFRAENAHFRRIPRRIHRFRRIFRPKLSGIHLLIYSDIKLGILVEKKIGDSTIHKKNKKKCVFDQKNG
jgi:hypothetical protein